MSKTIKGLPPDLRNLLGQLLEQLEDKRIFNSFGPLFDWFRRTLLEDGIMREKRLIYEAIADFLARKLQRDPVLSLALAYRVCGEEELPEEVADQAVSPELLQAAEALLATIKVHYQAADKRKCDRKIEIYHLQSGQPLRYEMHQELAWDDLPDQVRGKILREGLAEISFTLYPIDQ